MTGFLDGPRCGFDTETTSPDPLTAHILTAAIVHQGPDTDDYTVTSYLINPGVPIPPESTAIHGVTDAMVQGGGRPPAEALDEMASLLANGLRWGVPVVAFNLAFDWTVLATNLARYGLAPMADRIDTATPPLIDPIVLDKEFVRRLKGSGLRKLKPTTERYGVTLTDWHTADADAIAALRIAEAQFARYPRLRRMTAADLFAAQQRWRAEQQAGLQEWFRTKATPEQGGDPNKVIDCAWPLIPPVTAEEATV